MIVLPISLRGAPLPSSGVSRADRGDPVWHKRLGYLIQEVLDYIGISAAHLRENVVVRAVPTRDGERRIVYRYGVRGDVTPHYLVEKLRDILGRASSVLDIAMFTAVTAAQPNLSEGQRRKIYFPIVTSTEAWEARVASPPMQALTDAQRESLRAMQPFVTGHHGMSWLHEVHPTDKHRRPLDLATIPDPQFPMFFRRIDPPHGSTEYWVDWVNPLPAVQNRVAFVEYRSATAIRDAGVEDVPTTLATWVDGDWRDIQDFLWDVVEFTTRAASVLDDGDTRLADSMRNYFDAERRQLAAFNRMMRTGDAAAEAEWLGLAGMNGGGGTSFRAPNSRRPARLPSRPTTAAPRWSIGYEARSTDI